MRQTLHNLDQWLIKICGPWDGSPRIKLGSVKGVLGMVVVFVPLIGCIVVNVRAGRFIIPWVSLLSNLLVIIPVIYALRTPAKDRARSNVAQIVHSKGGV